MKIKIIKDYDSDSIPLVSGAEYEGEYVEHYGVKLISIIAEDNFPLLIRTDSEHTLFEYVD